MDTAVAPSRVSRVLFSFPCGIRFFFIQRTLCPTPRPSPVYLCHVHPSVAGGVLAALPCWSVSAQMEILLPLYQYPYSARKSWHTDTTKDPVAPSCVRRRRHHGQLHLIYSWIGRRVSGCMLLLTPPVKRYSLVVARPSAVYVVFSCQRDAIASTGRFRVLLHLVVLYRALGLLVTPPPPVLLPRFSTLSSCYHSPRPLEQQPQWRPRCGST